MKAKKIEQIFKIELYWPPCRAFCMQMWYWFGCILDLFCMNMWKVKCAKIATIRYIRLCQKKNLSFNCFCQHSKWHELITITKTSQLTDNAEFASIWLKTLSQTKMFLVTLSLVVFSANVSPSYRHKMHPGVLYLLNIKF